MPPPDSVPGLHQPVSISEYAKLEGLREADVLAVIGQLKIPAAFFRGQWFVEAPPNCEARLAQLRDNANNKQESISELISWLEERSAKHEQTQATSEPERARPKAPPEPQRVGETRGDRLPESPRRDPISQPKPVRAPVPQPVSNTQEDIGHASIMLPDQLRVPGLVEPLSAGEYAKLEGLDEMAVIEAAFHGRLSGVYSLGWYLEAPPYSEERVSRLRGEPKLEPRLANWLQRRADLRRQSAIQIRRRTAGRVA